MKVLKNIKRYKYWIFVPLNLSLMISLITVYINNLKTGFMIFFPVVLFLYEIALFLFIASVILKKFRTVTRKYRNEFRNELNNTANLPSVKSTRILKEVQMNKLSFLRDKVMIHPIVGAINKAELQKWIKGYTDPVIDILIWLIPIGAVLASLATLAVWFTKDDELKEREKPSRIIKKIVFWAFVGTGIVAIFKALGITSSGIG